MLQPKLNAYKEMGYTKETIINTLALLGWSTQEEIFSTNDLIANFDIKNVQKGGCNI